MDKGGKIDLQIKKLGKFEFRLEAKRERAELVIAASKSDIGKLAGFLREVVEVFR